MKAFFEIKADVETIAHEILDFMSDNDDIELSNGSPWKFLDTSSLLRACPVLFDFFRQHRLLVKDSAITYVTDANDLPMHVDEKPVVAKINFPVRNTKGWTNRWYTVDDLESYPKRLNQFGSEVYDLSGAQARPLTEYPDMPNPIVFNSSVPHSVEQYSDTAKSPRVVASFTFHNEPIEWLK